MQTAKVTFRGAEPFDLLKSYFPTTWGAEVLECRKKIEAEMQFFKCGLKEAVQINMPNSMSFETIVNLATLYIMTKEIRINAEIKTIDKDFVLIEKQRLALNNSKRISKNDAADIHLFYKEKQKELLIKRSQLVKEIESVAVAQVKSTTSLN